MLYHGTEHENWHRINMSRLLILRVISLSVPWNINHANCYAPSLITPFMERTRGVIWSQIFTLQPISAAATIRNLEFVPNLIAFLQYNTSRWPWTFHNWLTATKPKPKIETPILINIYLTPWDHVSHRRWWWWLSPPPPLPLDTAPVSVIDQTAISGRVPHQRERATPSG